MKQGFSVLELIVSMTIGAILITQVFLIYEYIGKATRKTQAIVQDDTILITLQNRIQKDITGLSPLWFYEKKEFEKSSANKVKDSSNTAATPKKGDAKVSNNESAHRSFFFSENKENNLYFFTFVTTNGMQTFNTPGKRFVRVVYLLQKDPNNENLFILKRKQISDISPEFNEEDLLKDSNFYEIASNIHSCSAEYGYIKKVAPDSNETNPSITWLPEWGIVREDSDTNEAKPSVPSYFKINLTFEKNIKNSSNQYELNFYLHSNPNIPIKLPKTKISPQKTNNKPEVSPKTAPQPGAKNAS